MCSGIISAARQGQCRQRAVTLDAGLAAESSEAARSPAGKRSAPDVPPRTRRFHHLHSALCGCRRIRRTAQRGRRKPRRPAQRQGDTGSSPAAAGAADDTETVAQRAAVSVPRPEHKRWPRRVMAGTGPVVAHAMHDCTPLYRAGDWEALRTRLRLDGYVLLRGVLKEAPVLKVELQTSSCSRNLREL